MIGALLDIALFLVITFFLLPLLIYTVYLHIVSDRFHNHGDSHPGDKNTPLPH